MPLINTPTVEQQQIINDIGNVVVTAKPGSGKTFTLVEKIFQISNSLESYQGVIAISYTNKASFELEIRCRNRGAERKKSFFGTIDRFYINEIIVPFSKHITNMIPEINIIESSSAVPEFENLSALSNKCIYDCPELEAKLIESLKQGYIFLNICGETAEYILSSVKECKEYLLARYTHIIIDEYQDCGYIQDKIFRQLVDWGITGIAVGDIDQAIFAFSNKYSKYLIELCKNDRFIQHEITRNLRCHKSISDYSLRLLGLSIPVPSGEKRVYKVLVNGGEKEIAQKIGDYLPRIMKKYEVANCNDVAILCRTKATCQRIADNIRIPYKLYDDAKLERLNSQWARFFCDFLRCYYDTSIFSVDFIDKYLNDEVAPKDYIKALSIVEKVFNLPESHISSSSAEIIQVANLVCNESMDESAIETLNETLNDPIELANFAPAKPNEINIMSLHKSKGLEFDIVFHMDLYQWVMPNPYNSAEDYEQMKNLHYVGITRAKKVCYIMQGSIRRNSAGKIYDAKESEFLYANELEHYRNNVSWNKD